MATEVHVHGLGEAYKRKEDARFIRGQGNYVDDVQLPGMLYGDIVRSPYAHALIKSIDISKAMQVPGVLAVITGKDLDAALDRDQFRHPDVNLFDFGFSSH